MHHKVIFKGIKFRPVNNTAYLAVYIINDSLFNLVIIDTLHIKCTKVLYENKAHVAM